MTSPITFLLAMLIIVHIDPLLVIYLFYYMTILFTKFVLYSALYSASFQKIYSFPVYSIYSNSLVPIICSLSFPYYLYVSLLRFVYIFFPYIHSLLFLSCSLLYNMISLLVTFMLALSTSSLVLCMFLHLVSFL